jgi:hypothetical protein
MNKAAKIIFKSNFLDASIKFRRKLSDLAKSAKD